MSPRNFILHAAPGEPVIALACEVCRTAVFYKSTTGAARAIDYHPKVCPQGQIKMVILLPSGNKRNRGPGGSATA